MRLIQCMRADILMRLIDEAHRAEFVGQASKFGPSVLIVAFLEQKIICSY